MSRVLLIEPHRVLQQALALSLFPEHDVRVEDSIDAGVIGGMKDTDLLIVDAAALRAAGKLAPDLQRALEAAKTPTLWIDDGSAQPKRANLTVMAPPITSGSLQSAVADLLSGGSEKPKKSAAAARAEAPAEAGAELIDLVEGVKEEAPDNTKEHGTLESPRTWRDRDEMVPPLARSRRLPAKKRRPAVLDGDPAAERDRLVSHGARASNTAA